MSGLNEDSRLFLQIQMQGVIELVGLEVAAKGSIEVHWRSILKAAQEHDDPLAKVLLDDWIANEQEAKRVIAAALGMM